MKLTGKQKILIAAGTLGLLWIAGKMYRAKDLTVRITRVDNVTASNNPLEGSGFTTDMQFINPSDLALNISLDTIIIKYNNQVLGQSYPDDRKLQIQAKSAVTFDNVKFQIPYINLLGAGILKTVLQPGGFQNLIKSFEFLVNANVNGVNFQYLKRVE
jgi:hypothetical protein